MKFNEFYSDFIPLHELKFGTIISSSLKILIFEVNIFNFSMFEYYNGNHFRLFSKIFYLFGIFNYFCFSL